MQCMVSAFKPWPRLQEHVRQDESDNEAEAEASESSGPVTASHGSNGLDNSGSAADNVSIQMSERSKEDGVSKQRCSAQQHGLGRWKQKYHRDLSCELLGSIKLWAINRVHNQLQGTSEGLGKIESFYSKPAEKL